VEEGDYRAARRFEYLVSLVYSRRE
jgi:hypothetical protein